MSDNDELHLLSQFEEELKKFHQEKGEKSHFD